MKHINARILILSLIPLLASITQQAMAQCTNPSINLPDQSQPVNNPAVSYCTEFTIDPSVTGNPLGLSMNITHTWQGDLSIRIIACGNTLMVMTRPGGGQCGGGCPCGSPNDMGGTYTFADGGGPNPDLGVSSTGGDYGVSTDPCGAGTVSSFAELLAGCPSSGTYTFTVCITDHAGADIGIATNVTPIFATNPLCGCTDPAASNYNPAANVDDGTCMYCNFSADATVTQPTCGQNNGAISVTPTGAGFTYAWSPAITNNSSVSNLAPGTYTITVSQAGCTSITTVTLNPSTPVSVTATPTNGTCGLANGSIFVSPNGPGHSYSWSPPTVTGANPINLSPGAYTVTVTAPGGCTGTATVLVNTTPPAAPMITGPLSFCAGNATILNAGAGYQSYVWSNGDVTQQTVVFAPGVYSVTVVNSDGCQGTTSVTVIQTPPPTPPINGNLSYCAGAFTTLSVPGGFNSYSWSNGSTGASTTVSSPGTYTVTVTQNGCTGTNSVTVTEVPTPQPTISGALAICAGSSTTLTVNGNYSSYAWSGGGGNGPSRVVSNPGTYTVTVTQNGCTGTASVTVTVSQPPSPVITGALSFCPGDGTILNAGNGYSSYQWSNGGSTTATLSVGTPGTYSVTVTNAAGCVGTASVTVTQSSIPTPAINGNTSICAGQSTTLTTGSFSSYAWSPSGSTQSINVNAPGTYRVTVTNAAGCQGSASVTVNQPASPTPTIVGNNSICVGESTTLNAGSGFSGYLWSPGGSTAQQITVSAGGTYNVTVTNAAGCPGTATFNVSQASSLTPVISGILNFCPGDQTALGVVGTYATYTWSTGSTNASINVGTANTYSVTVTSAGGCIGSTSVSVVQLPTPTPAITGDLDYCAGLTTQLNAGSGYASYLWGSGSTGQFDTISTPGLQSVTVTNNLGCEGTATATVVQNPNPTPNITGLTAICPTNGSTVLQVSGGPYINYQWSTGQSSASITADSTGSIEVTITNSNGCIGNTQTQITLLPPPMPTISGPAAICEGTSGTLVASGGFTDYSWSTGSNTQNTTVSAAGNYDVTVTDSNGCAGSTNFDVTENPLPVVSIAGDLDFCAGESSQLNAGAGFASYQWSNSQTGQFNTVNANGNVSVTVTDAAGCQNSATALVTEYNLPQTQIAGSFSFCINGTTTLSAGGGTFAAYLWSNGSTTPSISTGQPGDYALLVTDANGCSNGDTVTVQELTELTPSVTGDLAFCDGETTLLDAGTGYNTYLWSDGSDTPQLTVSSSGTYSVTVSNADGCMGQTSVIVVENLLPVVSINGAATFCEGSTSTLSATSGFELYQWTGGLDIATIPVTSGGNYQLSVTDVNGCQNTTAFSIQEIPLPTPSISGIPVFCPGASATLTANAGYQNYLWNNGQTVATISAATTDDFSVTVTDAFGCTGSTTVQVAEYVTSVPVISGVLDFCTGIGTSLNAAGNFVNYSWTGGIQSQALSVSQPGVYGVTTTDGNGCQTNAAVTVSEFTVTPPGITGIDEFCAGSMTTITAQPGYASYQWSNGTPGNQLTLSTGGTYTVTATDVNGCLSNASITITQNPLPVAAISGDLDYCIGNSTTLDAGASFAAYQWTGGAAAQTLTVNTPGTYNVTVTNAFGCQSSTAVSVIQNPLPQPQILGTAAFCDGNTSTLSSNTAFANYLWSNGASNAAITVAASGNYGLTVTDNNGCVNSTALAVTEHPLPQFNILGDLDFCDGLSSTLSVSNPYPTYLWSTQSSAASLPVNSSGNYSVTVTDANGCQNSNTVAVVEYPLPQVAITGTLFFCEGSSTTLNAPSGLAAYAWNNNPGAANLTVTTPGQYTVIGTGANGCSATATASVLEADVPVAVINPVSELDCATREVALSSNGSSQGNGFLYLWSGPDIQASEANSPNPMAGIAGAYTLTISDQAYNCPTATATINLIDLAYEPAASLLVTDVLDCNTASVQLNGSGSESGPGIVYRWYDAAGNLLSSSGAQNSYQVGQAGAYTLEVFDQLTSCVSTVSATVDSDFNYPVANAGSPRHLDCRNKLDLLDATGSSQGTQLSYAWSTSLGNIVQGSGTTTPAINAPGTYNLVVTNNQNGCTSNASVQVTQNIQQPNANAGQDQTLNCVISLVTLDASASVASQPLYRWVVAGTADTVAITPTLDLNVPGNYVLWVIDNLNGCADSDVANALLDEAFVQGFSVTTDQPTCFNDTDGSIVAHSVQGGTPPFVYSLNGAAFRPGGVFNNLGSGEYNILIQDALGCEYQEDAYIEVSNDLRVDAGPDQFIDWGDSVRIQAQVNVPSDEITSMKWQSPGTLPCANCPELVLGPLETTAYSIVVSDENGCVARDQVTVFVRRNRDVFIPNAFSPDNDGTNDVLMIFAGDEVVRVKSFQLFNRWGESVFEVYSFQPNDPIYGWNGTGRGGQIFNAAVFVYLAEVEFIDGSTQLYTGDVSLIR